MKGLAVSEILREPWPVPPDMVQSVGIGACLVGDYLPGTEGLDILRIGPLGYLICRQQVDSPIDQGMIQGADLRRTSSRIHPSSLR